MARLLRRKSKLLVAFGSCACEGCIPGLANLGPARSILDTAFSTISTDDAGGIRPAVRHQVAEGELHIPELFPMLRTLDDIVPVDYYMPGCPPESEQIAAVVDLVIAALKGEVTLPPAGSVIGAGDSTVCDDCPRRRNVKSITSFRRIQDLTVIDPDICLLEQGVPCNGPATRNGCGARCPKAGAQCIGCYGPAEGVNDFGARLMTAFASVVEADTPEAIDAVLDTLPDPVGQFYRFNLAGSLLHAARSAWQTNEEI